MRRDPLASCHASKGRHHTATGVLHFQASEGKGLLLTTPTRLSRRGWSPPHKCGRCEKRGKPHNRQQALLISRRVHTPASLLPPPATSTCSSKCCWQVNQLPQPCFEAQERSSRWRHQQCISGMQHSMKSWHSQPASRTPWGAPAEKSGHQACKQSRCGAARSMAYHRRPWKGATAVCQNQSSRARQ